MTTAIVILNWNGAGFLTEYLPPLLDSVRDMEGVSVVVADNASTDNSLEVLKRDFPQIQVIPLKKNFGFAGGYNKALNHLDQDCFLLLNSDVEVSPDWFYPLQEWMQMHPECGICGPKLHMTTQRDRFEYAGAAGGLIDKFGYPFCRGRVMKRTETDEGQYDIPAEVMWVSGAALMIRSCLYFRLGGLCDEFFAHMEEIDLCWRARLQGWKVCTVPRSVVYHVGGGSLPASSPRKLFFNYRNNLLMLKRNLPQTFALYYVFNVLALQIEPDEGPDMTLNCLDLFNDLPREESGYLVRAAVKLALASSSALVRKRMLLDVMSALVYLFTLKPASFRAVLEAHRQYREMKPHANEKHLAHFVRDALKYENENIPRTMLKDLTQSSNSGRTAFEIRGMWNKWTVWESFFKKDTIFAEIKDLV